MNVSQYLDLEDGGQLLTQAQDSWAGWCDQEPRLQVVNFDGLRQWLEESPPAEVDDVLHALATLAASDGGDDIAAAGLLAWALLPGACALVRDLRGLPGDTHLLVASQLWIEVRSFAWRRLRKVAANLLRNTRTGCLKEAGTASQLRRTDRTWSTTAPVDPTSLFWDHVAAGGPPRLDPDSRGTGKSSQSETDGPLMRRVSLAPPPEQLGAADEVVELLAWACDNEVISQPDRDLLLCLMEEADQVDTGRFGRTVCGLTAAGISVRVAPRVGLSQTTVRRRATRSIRALAEAADRYVA